MILNKIIRQPSEIELSIPSSIKPCPPILRDRVREIIRIKHYSYQTEETYVFWIRRYILFHDKQHQKDMNSVEIEAFLSHLAIKENVAASTQNQALSALLFLYREVLRIELNAPVDAIRAKGRIFSFLPIADSISRPIASAYRPNRFRICSIKKGITWA